MGGVATGAISVAACILLLWWVDWSAFQETIQRANGAWLMVAFLTIHADRWFMAYKWRDLLTASGTAVSVGNTIKAYYIGSFWSAFLPASVGGDLVRISCLRKRVRPLENLGVENLGVENFGVEKFDASE